VKEVGERIGASGLFVCSRDNIVSRGPPIVKIANDNSQEQPTAHCGTHLCGCVLDPLRLALAKKSRPIFDKLGTPSIRETESLYECRHLDLHCIPFRARERQVQDKVFDFVQCAGANPVKSRVSHDKTAKVGEGYLGRGRDLFNQGSSYEGDIERRNVYEDWLCECRI